MYGRTENEWDQLKRAAEDHLIETAQSRSMSDYSRLNRELTQATGFPGFDYNKESDRAAVGRLLGEISRNSHSTNKIMLSALVTHRGSNNEGAGFYKLAAELKEMPSRASADQKLVAMSQLVEKVHEFYRRR